MFIDLDYCTQKCETLLLISEGKIRKIEVWLFLWALYPRPTIQDFKATHIQSLRTVNQWQSVVEILIGANLSP
jgi:hypothetical protein